MEVSGFDILRGWPMRDSIIPRGSQEEIVSSESEEEQVLIAGNGAQLNDTCFLSLDTKRSPFMTEC